MVPFSPSEMTAAHMVRTPAGRVPYGWVDLGRDDCTLYYFNFQHIGRFNVCTQTALPALPNTLPDVGYTLLVLYDGTLLVNTELGHMLLLRPDGTVLRNYTTIARAYARDTNPNFVWVVFSTGKVGRFDLTNDVIAPGSFDPGISPSGIVVVGADAQAIPVLSPLLLMLFGLSVAFAALVRIRA